MKTFGQLISEVAEPKAGDEKHFKAKHITTKKDHPTAPDTAFTGGTKKAPKRIADYDKGEDELVYEGSFDVPTAAGGEHDEEESHKQYKEGNKMRNMKSEAKTLDPVDPTELKKKFKDRSDKDIDNDGDVDSSDEYLHARRKAISKAIKKEEAENLEEISRDLARSYIRKAMSHKTTGEKPKKDRSSGVNLAGKKAYDIGGSAKIKATESVELEEKLKASDDMGKWIDDFQKSDNPKFAGKSQKKRREMAVAAKYAAEREAGMRESEQLDELSPNTLSSYIKKAAGNMAGNAAVGAAQASSSMKKSTPEVKRNIKNRMKGIASASNRLADKANMAESAWEEIPMMQRQLQFIAYAAEEISDYLSMGVDPEEWFQNKLAGLHQTMLSMYAYAQGEMQMSGGMYGEEVELDESLAAYVTRKAKAQAKMKKEEVGINEVFKAGDKVHWEDPDSGKRLTGTIHMVKGSRKGVARVKADGTHGSVWDVHHSHLNKMDEEVEQIDEISKGLVGRYLDKARSQRGSDKDREKSIGLAYRKSTPGKRADSGYDSEPKVYAKEDLDESITKMPHSRLKFHLNTNTPHGSYSNAEMKAERDRRLKTGEGEAYRKAKAGLSEVTRSAIKKPVTYIDAEGKSRTRLVPLHKVDRDDHGQEKIKESFLDEAFKEGAMKLKDGSMVVVKSEDAKLLNRLMNNLNDKNRSKMESTLMSNKKGFNEILGFAREAL